MQFEKDVNFKIPSKLKIFKKRKRFENIKSGKK